ncbi:MAG TPA: (d)CMP kinase [Acidobacteriota bacterium]|nr:(d)CMP kinase [Acidobacteriota bacterium]
MPTEPAVPPAFRGAVITIDGPAGSGKSVTARLLAARIGFTYIDTGAMYRSAAWLADRLGTDLDDETQVAAMLDRFDFKSERAVDGIHVMVGDEDVSDAIRTPRIDRLVSPIAAHPLIRRFMAKWQRQCAAVGNVVLEGRDTGTVVCPDADAKIFLDASLETRAIRRLRQRGEEVNDAVLTREKAEIERRDRADRDREHAPLRCADDAVVVDTTGLTLDGQVEAVYRACERRLAVRGD